MEERFFQPPRGGVAIQAASQAQRSGNKNFKIVSSQNKYKGMNPKGEKLAPQKKDTQSVAAKKGPTEPGIKGKDKGFRAPNLNAPIEHKEDGGGKKGSKVVISGGC